MNTDRIAGRALELHEGCSTLAWASATQPSGCIHDPAQPQGCYRVRCQLGERCVELPEDDDA